MLFIIHEKEEHRGGLLIESIAELSTSHTRETPAISGRNERCSAQIEETNETSRP